MKVIDISKSKQITFQFRSAKDYKNTEGKGWSFSNVYSFEEIRDLYILLMENGYIESVEKFTAKRVIPLVMPKGKSWTSRRVREILNAMVNFNWFERNTNGCNYWLTTKTPLFLSESLGKELTDCELDIFKKVFFEYERFREYLSLYHIDNNSDDVIINSIPIYSFSAEDRYTDVFFKSLDDNVDLMCIKDEDSSGQKSSGFKSFWDVFVSWAQKLNLMEKFNSNIFNMRLSNGKSFSCSYFNSSKDVCLPPLPCILKDLYPNRKVIDVNKLIFKICIIYRKPVKEVKEYIILQYSIYKKYISIVRTSEIFINRSEKKDDNAIAYPKYENSFISHLIIQ